MVMRLVSEVQPPYEIENVAGSLWSHRLEQSFDPQPQPAPEHVSKFVSERPPVLRQTVHPALIGMLSAPAPAVYAVPPAKPSCLHTRSAPSELSQNLRSTASRQMDNKSRAGS